MELRSSLLGSDGEWKLSLSISFKQRNFESSEEWKSTGETRRMSGFSLGDDEELLGRGSGEKTHFRSGIHDLISDKADTGNVEEYPSSNYNQGINGSQYNKLRWTGDRLLPHTWESEREPRLRSYSNSCTSVNILSNMLIENVRVVPTEFNRSKENISIL